MSLITVEITILSLLVDMVPINTKHQLEPLPLSAPAKVQGFIFLRRTRCSNRREIPLKAKASSCWNNVPTGIEPASQLSIQ